MNIKRLLLEEKYNRLKKKQWRQDPMLWLEERLGEKRSNLVWTDFPEYKNHKWDGDRNPIANAWLSLAKGYWVGIEAATGTGKTYTLARIVMWFLDVYDDSLVITSAPKQDQLKLNLWAEMSKIMFKFRKLHEHAEMFNLRLVVDNRNVDLDDEENLSKSHQAIGFVAGVGSNEDSATKAQGFHRENMLIICEETPGMNEAIMTAFQNTCTATNNLILAVGNPDHRLDTLHKFCMLPKVKNYRVSAYDYPNVVLGKEIFPGAVSIASIERRIDKFGKDSKMYNSRVRGISPSQSADSLIKLDWILSVCIAKKDYHEYDAIPHDDWSYNALGVDVSNSENGDKACLVWGKSNRMVSIQEFYCNNANDLALNTILTDDELLSKGRNIYHTNKIQDFEIHPDHVGVDAVGVGVGTINTYEEYNYKVVSLHGGYWAEAVPYDDNGDPMYQFNSLRAQMYFTFALEIQKREFVIEISDMDILERFIEEAVSPKLVTNGRSIAIESKEDIKKKLGRSPNILDAAVYWNWMRKNRRGFMGSIGTV